MRKFLLPCIFISVITHGYPQSASFRFMNLTEQQGLADANIASIIKDKTGYLWFASSEGLNRFDGKTCKVYHHLNTDTNSISDDNINVIFEDSKQQLWIGTRKGLNLYDNINDNFTTYYFNESDPESVSSNEIWSIAEDQNGYLWVGTRGGGLNRITGKIKVGPTTECRFKRFQYDSTRSNSLSSNIVWSIAFDKSGYGWIGTENGLNYFKVHEPFDNEISFESYKKTADLNSIADNSVWKVIVDENEDIWLLSFYGMLDCISKKSRLGGAENLRFIHVLPGLEKAVHENNLHVLSLVKDQSGKICIGTDKSGFIRCSVFIHPESLSVTINEAEYYLHNDQDDESLINNSIISLYEDDNRLIWIGTTNGISMYNPQRKLFDTLQFNNIDDIRKQAVRLVYSDNEYTWLVINSTIWMTDNKSYKPILLCTLSKAAEITCLFRTAKGALLIASSSLGIYMLTQNEMKAIAAGKLFPSNPAKIEFSNELNNATIFSITAVNDHQLLVAGYSRLGIFDINEKKFINYLPLNKASSQIFRCVASYGDMIYAGADDGLFQLNRNTNTVSYFTPKAGKLSSDRITSLLIANNKLWIGTISGLNVYDLSSQTVTNYFIENGLADNNITSLCPDNTGDIWIATRKGASCYDKKSGIFRNFNINQGLNANQLNSLALSSDILFVAGEKGVNTLHPSSLKTADKSLKVVINDFKIAGSSLFIHPMPERGRALKNNLSIYVNWRENNISIDFNALEYENIQGVNYAYTLKNFDKEWTYNGAFSTASYTNLPGGDYVFMVKYAGNSGLWHLADMAIPIHVSTAWFKAWWFYLSCTLVIIMLCYTYYRLRLNRIIELHKVRNKIARDLHDDIGSTLSTINILSKTAEKKVSTDAGYVGQMLEKIGNSSRNMMDAMSDIVWSINPDHDNVNSIAVRMREYTALVLEPKEIDYIISTDELVAHVKLPLEKRRDLYLLYKEAVNNLAKYSAASKAEITLGVTNKILRLCIKDNGKGFNVTILTSGNGLQNMKQRARQLGGHVEIVSAENEGTQVMLQVPLT